jgi:SAM-dependent methyltransferase
VGLASFLKTVLQIPERYAASHFERRDQFRQDYARLAASLLAHLDFTSVLDVGCANGFLLTEFLAAGKSVEGLELSAEVMAVLPEELRAVVRVGDFAAARGSFDLVCCVEMAEHIPRRRSDELVETLCATARRWIFFTAAPPGQTGRGHINCQPRAAWETRFAARGWRQADDELSAVSRDLERLAEARWLATNAMLFEPAGR